MGDMANISMSEVSLPATSAQANIYFDSAAEFSKLDRTGWHQASPKTGRPIMYDLLITMTCDVGESLEALVATAPNNWQTRNACRQFHLWRAKLRRASKTPKSHVGKYGKSIRYNLDLNMQSLPYTTPASISVLTTQRIFSMDDNANAAGDYLTGGTWDYTQITSEDDEDGFFLNICGTSSATTSGPYTYVSVLEAYNQHRLHV